MTSPGPHETPRLRRWAMGTNARRSRWGEGSEGDP